MSKNKNTSTKAFYFAATLSAVAFTIHFIQQLVGFDKMNIGATPKTFPEVMAEWPRLLATTVAVFLGTLWWRLTQKKKVTLICSHCQEPVDQEAESDLQEVITCQKCGGKLESIEGYYDRHPDRR